MLSRIGFIGHIWRIMNTYKGRRLGLPIQAESTDGHGWPTTDPPVALPDRRCLCSFTAYNSLESGSSANQKTARLLAGLWLVAPCGDCDSRDHISTYILTYQPSSCVDALRSRRGGTKQSRKRIRNWFLLPTCPDCLNSCTPSIADIAIGGMNKWYHCHRTLHGVRARFKLHKTCNSQTVLTIHGNQKVCVCVLIF